MNADMLMSGALLLAVVLAALLLVRRRSPKDASAASSGGRRRPGLTLRDLRKKDGAERNGNREDLLETYSALTSFARRRRFQLIAPATIRAGEDTAPLSAILITRSRVVAINCYGYGGTIQGAAGDGEWTQILGGTRKRFKSPAVRNRELGEVLRRVMARSGCGQMTMETMGIFTTPGVKLEKAEGSSCVTRKEMTQYLKQERFMADGGVDPQDVYRRLDANVLKAGK